MATFKAGKVKFEEAGSEAAFGYVKGSAKWAKVTAVDDFGNYSVSMYGDEVVEMREELEAMRDSAFDEVVAGGKKAEKADVVKVDNDGNEFIGFKLPEMDFEGNPNKIKFYDAGGSELKDFNELVGNGSLVKIKYRIAPYYMASTKKVGVSFKFYAMQLIKHVEYTGGGDSGFGDESGDTISGEVSKDGEDF
jgi:hypothetical protein